MDDDQQFCLRWNNHQSTLISVFDTLLENQTLVDCTLAAEGKFLKAHKVVLSACSPYFATLLQEQYDKHPIFILKDVKFQELRAMMDYMYRGEVNISQDQLAALLKAAESLQIKGLSDNRSTGNINPAPKLDGAHQQHRNLNVGANVGIKIGGGYTLEQTKRTRLGPNALDVQEMSGSREGSSSPSRRRKKVRRRSIEASLADIQHDNSNSSLQQQSNVVISAPGISNVNPISAAASVLAAAQLPSGATPGTVVGTSQTVASSSSAAAAAAAANIAPGLVAAATQQMLTNVTKKTESVKGAASSEAMNTDELATGVSVDEQEQQQQTATKVDKHNHKYKATSGKDSTDIVEPKSEYDDDGNEGTVEDLTLDEEDMGIDDLDQNAGTSHVGEGSSQGYAPWQHERSQDDLLMTQQDAQQRDPQVLQVKGDHNNSTLDRFPCDVCGKSYLRKRHLQRHMRDECIGIPPRFSCELCSSRFRRKYHMVRHLTSKHNIPHDIAQQATGGGTRHAANNSNNNNNSIQNGSIDLNVFNLKMESNKKSNSDVKNGGAENLTLRKDLFGGCGQNETDNQKNGENMSTSPAHSGGAYSSSGTHSPMAGHFLMPFCGLSGAITAIPANAGAGLDYDKPIYANVKVKDAINVKAEPLSPTKVENLALSVTTDPTDADNQVDEDWKLKLSMQLISNSLLKERLINNLTFSAGYNSNN